MRSDEPWSPQHVGMWRRVVETTKVSGRSIRGSNRYLRAYNVLECGHRIEVRGERALDAKYAKRRRCSACVIATTTKDFAIAQPAGRTTGGGVVEVDHDAPDTRLLPRGCTGSISTLGLLILALQDLQRQADDRGQPVVTMWNSHPMAGAQVALCDRDGKLFLQVLGFDT